MRVVTVAQTIKQLVFYRNLFKPNTLVVKGTAHYFMSVGRIRINLLKYEPFYKVCNLRASLNLIQDD